jgi:hypothetical protein
LTENDMAEPGLTLAFSDLQIVAGVKLGYSATTGDWSSAETAEVARIIQAALRQFMYPPPLQGERLAHKWSFMEPTATLVLWPDTTGTAVGQGSYSAATGLTTFTASASVFVQSMTSHDLTFDTSSTGYNIAGYTSGTVVTLTGDASGEASGDTFALTADGDYDMPDDFGGIVGPFTFGEDEAYTPVQPGPEYKVREMRQFSSTTGTPSVCAIRPKTTDGVAGQRWESLWYPVPDGTYNVSYTKRVQLDQISATYPYPWGGSPHSETIRQSVRDIAAQTMDEEYGWEHQRFLELLAASVSYDKEMGTPDYMGYNQDWTEWGRVPAQTTDVTYNDVLYDNS